MSIFRSKPKKEEDAPKPYPTYNVGKTKYTVHLKNGRSKSFVWTGYAYISSFDSPIIISSDDLFTNFLKRSKCGFVNFGENEKGETVSLKSGKRVNISIQGKLLFTPYFFSKIRCCSFSSLITLLSNQGFLIIKLIAFKNLNSLVMTAFSINP